MTRPRPKPSGVQTLRDLARRVSAAERNTRQPVVPAAVSNAATINQTAAQSPFMALVNPVGTQITWWVLVTPTVGTTTSLRLRTAAGMSGNVVTANSAAATVAQVTLTISDGWQPGDLELLYLDCWIDVNSATVLPVKAQIA